MVLWSSWRCLCSQLEFLTLFPKSRCSLSDILSGPNYPIEADRETDIWICVAGCAKMTATKGWIRSNERDVCLMRYWGIAGHKIFESMLASTRVAVSNYWMLTISGFAKTSSPFEQIFLWRPCGKEASSTAMLRCTRLTVARWDLRKTLRNVH